jgi:hypothetical protein
MIVGAKPSVDLLPISKLDSALFKSIRLKLKKYY